MVYVTINYWAVLLAGVLSMASGAFWYSSWLFGNAWMKVSKMSAKDIAKAKKSGSVKRSYAIMFLTTLVTGYVLSHFVDYIGAVSLLGGVQLGFWLWLGIAAPLQLGMVLWEGKPVKLYLINTGHTLFNLVLVCAVLAVWA
ncbi:DUF1761 domain-containing protein [Candidatus Woesearchaeota archaeon]|nr:DUF1761 domain-containing protein [Candidatus Woesearchaeota archaeon]